MRAESLHAKRQTDTRTSGQIDMTKLKVGFHNFVNAPKKDAMLH